MESIVDILVERDGLSQDAAEFEVEQARKRVVAGENPETILREDFGLEPDYVWELIP